MKNLPRSVSLALWLILLNAAFWFIYAVLVASGVAGVFPLENVVKWVMVGLALGCAVALISATFFLLRRSRLAFYAAVVLLALIAVLSVTDDFGLPDLVSLLLSLIPLGLLFKDRTWYLQPGAMLTK